MNQATKEFHDLVYKCVISFAIIALIIALGWVYHGASLSVVILFALALLVPFFSWVSLRHVLIGMLSYHPEDEVAGSIQAHFGKVIILATFVLIFCGVILLKLVEYTGVVIR